MWVSLKVFIEYALRMEVAIGVGSLLWIGASPLATNRALFEVLEQIKVYHRVHTIHAIAISVPSTRNHLLVRPNGAAGRSSMQ